MRPSIDRARIADPRYSITWPMPPPVPISPRIARITSLAVTPGCRSPSTVTDIHFGRCWGSVWVASTCSTSLVPMPKASAPNAPWVAVWRVAAHDGHARQGAALLRADDVHDALVGIAHREVGDAELGGVRAQRLDLLAPRSGRRSAGRCRSVGTLWSSVAIVRSGRRTVRPVRRSPSNACGLVTSWTRCRSMYSRSGSSGAECTRWRSHTFSGSVLPMSTRRSLSSSQHMGYSSCDMDIVTGVGVLDKAMSVIGAVADAPRTLGELQAETQLPRATAHRLATALEAHGLLRRDADGRFDLGQGLVPLGRTAAERFSLVDVARPVLEQLRDDTGESVQLFVREGDAASLRAVARVDPRSALDRPAGCVAPPRCRIGRPGAVRRGRPSRMDREHR